MPAPTPATPTCLVRPSIKERPLLSPIQAGGLAAVFKVLANDTRLRLLHALIRADELGVNELAETIGMKAPAVSNQLQRLVDLGILGSQRQGTSIRYRVIDPCIRGLLEQGWCLIEEATQRSGLTQRVADCRTEETGCDR